VHGWVVLDKPSGVTSTDAVTRVKRMFDASKAGHSGTLDPLANGVLPIALGEATKTVPFVVDGLKSYRFAVQWGADTETDDAEGKVLGTSDVRPTLEEIELVLPEFIGEIEQVPPRYSAIKVDGARAYDLARDGDTFELSARKVQVNRLEVVEVPDRDHCIFEADCGKGTYVRSLARDFGRRLGTLGHIRELRRTRVGPFHSKSTISLDKLEELSHSAAGQEGLDAVLHPVETALDDIPALAVSGDDAAKLARGQAVLLRGRDAPIISGPVYATSRGHLVALGEVKRGELRPKRVFNLHG